eukprot:TRINITY_DN4158_c0_g1_i4.p1 TRINITY_DN4158_c0_g1~~TRINITY_DN4158_c0_g1_i4.p1  ORF type:complete len:148 (-),score=21.87 TRINITY_DN4158_c0_g1_i4:320-763(-)
MPTTLQNNILHIFIFVWSAITLVGWAVLLAGWVKGDLKAGLLLYYPYLGVLIVAPFFICHTLVYLFFHNAQHSYVVRAVITLLACATILFCGGAVGLIPVLHWIPLHENPEWTNLCFAGACIAAVGATITNLCMSLLVDERGYKQVE